LISLSENLLLEKDLIEESEDKLSAFEFKWGDRVQKAPRAFLTSYPEAEYSVITKDNYLAFVLTSWGGSTPDFGSGSGDIQTNRPK